MNKLLYVMMISSIICHFSAVASERSLSAPIREAFGARDGRAASRRAVEQDQAKGWFRIELARQTISMRQKIEAGVIHPTNPLVMSLTKLLDDFLEVYDRNIDNMIKGEGLRSRILAIAAAVDSHVSVKKLRQKMNGHAAMQDIEREVLEAKFDLSSLELQKKHPTFSVLLLQDMSGKERETNYINFLNKNEQYPSTEPAQKDYMALFLYQRWYLHKSR